MHQLMEELKSIRLACVAKKKGNKLRYQIETVPKHLQKVTNTLGITNDSIRAHAKDI